MHSQTRIPITASRCAIYSAILGLSIAGGISAQQTGADGFTVEGTPASGVTEPATQKEQRLAWWKDAKFGMFIHWGVYAVPAGKYGNDTNHGEWIMRRANIPVAEYKQYAAAFNPLKYQPDAWARLAKQAGMRYIVITSKHHDGFALYPSDVTDWDVADATPYGKDLLGPLVKAARNEGLRIGFYYSQSQDWVHPGGAKSGYKDGEGWDEAHKGSFDEYLKKIAVPQVGEILKRYPIDILWWDTPALMTRERAEPFARMVRARPGLITNNRLGGGFYGDTATPEQFVPVTGYRGNWETCMTMNRHWGYNAWDHDWKSSAELIRKLAEICAKGGNFLLNVGPTAEGEIPAPSVERLKAVGEWLAKNGDAIYGTQAGPFPWLSWGTATRKGKQLYLHVFDWPADGKLCVPLTSAVASAHTLAAPGQALDIEKQAGRIIISVPTAAPDPVNSIVVLTLAGEPEVIPLPTLGASVTASATLDGSDPANIIDGTGSKRWQAPVGVTRAELDVILPEPTTIRGFGFDEPDVWPRLRQSFTLQAETADGWQTLAQGETDGHGAKGSIEPVKSAKFRLTIERKGAPPSVAELQLYRPE